MSDLFLIPGKGLSVFLISLAQRGWRGKDVSHVCPYNVRGVFPAAPSGLPFQAERGFCDSPPRSPVLLWHLTRGETEAPWGSGNQTLTPSHLRGSGEHSGFPRKAECEGLERMLWEEGRRKRERPRGAAPGRERRPGPGGSWRWHGLPACHQAPQLLEIGGSILWGVNRLFEDRSVAQTMQLLTRCRLLPGAPGSEAPPDGESWRPDAGPGWEEASESARWRGRSRALWAGRSRGVWKGAQGPGACVCGRAAGFICKHGTSAESRGRSGAVGVIREGRCGAGARSQAGLGASRGATGEA